MPSDQMTPDKWLMAWVAIRSSLDTRLYWFYLAITTALGLILNALRDDVDLSSTAARVVLFVMGAMAVVTGLNYLALACWDVKRLNYIARSLAAIESGPPDPHLFEVAGAVKYGPAAATVGFVAAILAVACLKKMK